MSIHNDLLNHIQRERSAVAKLYGSSAQSVTEEEICRIVWDLFPSEVLCDPTQKYLDYACGKGTILLHGIKSLFVALQNSIEDPVERLNHIVKEQIYGIDIDRAQIDIARSAIKRLLKDPKATINIECADSLTKDFTSMERKFNLATNVPFQKGKDPNFYMKFRNDLNERLGDQLKYKVIISPNYLTLTSKNNACENLSVYKDLGNAFKSIKLPAGVCVTREDPTKTNTAEFTDLDGNTTVVDKKDFVVVADSSVLPVIKKIQQNTTLDSVYIHDSNKIDTIKEDKKSNVFYVDKAGETDKDVKGFYVNEAEGNVRIGSFVVFAYNAPGDPLDVGNKKLGPVKTLKKGRYIFSRSVVALQLKGDNELENCKKLLDCNWAKNIIKSVKYATNNSKSLLGVLPYIDFTAKFDEGKIIDTYK